jgi:hypothetical protein
MVKISKAVNINALTINLSPEEEIGCTDSFGLSILYSAVVLGKNTPPSSTEVSKSVLKVSLDLSLSAY